jgi:hypothetical protein
LWDLETERKAFNHEKLLKVRTLKVYQMGRRIITKVLQNLMLHVIK